MKLASTEIRNEKNTVKVWGAQDCWKSRACFKI